ncbi:hypothetical protein [Niveispirillum sp. SYP-B3756]|uniref:hypothetical protein n=1 Tax=Niveispirillum sp. SYP-B3756 TaxID=2662178 RepID=UPI001292B413|nr:hypothetical protein [Niveispirillum sp. SYP-B3756]
MDYSALSHCHITKRGRMVNQLLRGITPDHQSFMAVTQNNQTKCTVSLGFPATNSMGL